MKANIDRQQAALLSEVNGRCAHHWGNYTFWNPIQQCSGCGMMRVGYGCGHLYFKYIGWADWNDTGYITKPTRWNAKLTESNTP